MCRNIRPLNNFEPPATSDEVRAAALQYVRKVSGATKPSKANEEVFNRAVEEIAHITAHLLEDLVTTAPPKDRETESEKAKARSAKRFANAVTLTPFARAVRIAFTSLSVSRVRGRFFGSADTPIRASSAAPTASLSRCNP